MKVVSIATSFLLIYSPSHLASANSVRADSELAKNLLQKIDFMTKDLAARGRLFSDTESFAASFGSCFESEEDFFPIFIRDMMVNSANAQSFCTFSVEKEGIEKGCSEEDTFSAQCDISQLDWSDYEANCMNRGGYLDYFDFEICDNPEEEDLEIAVGTEKVVVDKLYAKNVPRCLPNNGLCKKESINIYFQAYFDSTGHNCQKEDPKAEFFWKRKELPNGKRIPITKSCEWLSKKKAKYQQKICFSADFQLYGKDDTLRPASRVCHSTCKEIVGYMHGDGSDALCAAEVDNAKFMATRDDYYPHEIGERSCGWLKKQGPYKREWNCSPFHSIIASGGNYNHTNTAWDVCSETCNSCT